MTGIDTRILSIRKDCSAVQGTFAGDAADSVGSERFLTRALVSPFATNDLRDIECLFESPRFHVAGDSRFAAGVF